MRAFIFDLDGTLVDSLEDIGQACNDVLASHGYPVHPLPAYRFYVGRGFHKLVNDALPEGEAAKLSSDQLTALIAEARARYGENMCVRTKPYAGITEALHHLADDGHALAVLSNKPDDLTVELVRRYFPDVPFALVRGGREGVPLKPEPDAPLDMKKASWCVSALASRMPRLSAPSLKTASRQLKKSPTTPRLAAHENHRINGETRLSGQRRGSAPGR